MFKVDQINNQSLQTLEALKTSQRQTERVTTENPNESLVYSKEQLQFPPKNNFHNIIVVNKVLKTNSTETLKTEEKETSSKTILDVNEKFMQRDKSIPTILKNERLTFYNKQKRQKEKMMAQERINTEDDFTKTSAIDFINQKSNNYTTLSKFEQSLNAQNYNSYQNIPRSDQFKEEFNQLFEFEDANRYETQPNGYFAAVYKALDVSNNLSGGYLNHTQNSKSQVIDITNMRVNQRYNVASNPKINFDKTPLLNFNQNDYKRFTITNAANKKNNWKEMTNDQLRQKQIVKQNMEKTVKVAIKTQYNHYEIASNFDATKNSLPQIRTLQNSKQNNQSNRNCKSQGGYNKTKRMTSRGKYQNNFQLQAKESNILQIQKINQQQFLDNIKKYKKIPTKGFPMQLENNQGNKTQKYSAQRSQNALVPIPRVDKFDDPLLRTRTENDEANKDETEITFLNMGNNDCQSPTPTRIIKSDNNEINYVRVDSKPSLEIDQLKGSFTSVEVKSPRSPVRTRTPQKTKETLKKQKASNHNDSSKESMIQDSQRKDGTYDMKSKLENKSGKDTIAKLQEMKEDGEFEARYHKQLDTSKQFQSTLGIDGEKRNSKQITSLVTSLDMQNGSKMSQENDTIHKIQEIRMGKINLDGMIFDAQQIARIEGHMRENEELHTAQELADLNQFRLFDENLQQALTQDEKSIQEQINLINEQMIKDYYQNKYTGMYQNILGTNPRRNYGGSYRNVRSYIKQRSASFRERNSNSPGKLPAVNHTAQGDYASTSPNRLTMKGKPSNTLQSFQDIINTKPQLSARRILDELDPLSHKNLYFNHLQNINKEKGHAFQQLISQLHQSKKSMGKSDSKSPKVTKNVAVFQEVSFAKETNEKCENALSESHSQKSMPINAISNPPVPNRQQRARVSVIDTDKLNQSQEEVINSKGDSTRSFPNNEESLVYSTFLELDNYSLHKQDSKKSQQQLTKEQKGPLSKIRILSQRKNNKIMKAIAKEIQVIQEDETRNFDSTEPEDRMNEKAIERSNRLSPAPVQDCNSLNVLGKQINYKTQQNTSAKALKRECIVSDQFQIIGQSSLILNQKMNSTACFNHTGRAGFDMTMNTATQYQRESSGDTDTAQTEQKMSPGKRGNNSDMLIVNRQAECEFPQYLQDVGQMITIKQIQMKHKIVSKNTQSKEYIHRMENQLKKLKDINVKVLMQEQTDNLFNEPGLGTMQNSQVNTKNGGTMSGSQTFRPINTNPVGSIDQIQYSNNSVAQIDPNSSLLEEDCDFSSRVKNQLGYNRSSSQCNKNDGTVLSQQSRMRMTNGRPGPSLHGYLNQEIGRKTPVKESSTKTLEKQKSLTVANSGILIVSSKQGLVNQKLLEKQLSNERFENKYMTMQMHIDQQVNEKTERTKLAAGRKQNLDLDNVKSRMVSQRKDIRSKSPQNRTISIVEEKDVSTLNSLEQHKSDNIQDLQKLANLKEFVANKTSNMNSPFVQNDQILFIRHSEDTLYKTEANNPKQQSSNSRSITNNVNYAKEQDIMSTNRQNQSDSNSKTYKRNSALSNFVAVGQNELQLQPVNPINNSNLTQSSPYVIIQSPSKFRESTQIPKLNLGPYSQRSVKEVTDEDDIQHMDSIRDMQMLSEHIDNEMALESPDLRNSFQELQVENKD